MWFCFISRYLRVVYCRIRYLCMYMFPSDMREQIVNYLINSCDVMGRCMLKSPLK